MSVEPRSLRQTLLLEFLERVWNQGAGAAVDDYLADTYLIEHDPGDPWDGRRLDRPGYRDRLQQSRAPFPDQRFDVQHLSEGADHVVIAWLWNATHLGDIPGFPASGRRIGMSGATVYRFDADNRISGHWQVTDRLGVFRQLQNAENP